MQSNNRSESAILTSEEKKQKMNKNTKQSSSEGFWELRVVFLPPHDLPTLQEWESNSAS